MRATSHAYVSNLHERVCVRVVCVMCDVWCVCQ